MKIKTKTSAAPKKADGKHRFTIRAKLMIMSVAIAMIPLILSFFISATISMENGQTEAYARVADRTDSVAAQVSAYVEQGYSVIEGLACGTDIRGLDPVLQHDILVKSVENNPAFILMYQQDTNGDQTARSSGTLGNRADRWWFIQEMQTKKPFVSKSYFDLNTKEAVTSIVFPVWGDDNQMTGVLAADFSLTKLQEIVDRYNTEDMHTIIIDGEGNVIAHINTAEVQQMYNYINATKAVQNGSTSEEVSAAIPAELQRIAKDVVNGGTGTYEIESGVDSDMAGYIFGYAPVEIPGDSGNWGVITVEKTSAAYASTYTLIQSILILTLVMVVVVIVVALFFARNLTQPLLKLSGVAEQIAAGDLNVTVATQANDEIGDVSQALNKTVVRLKSYIDYINEITQVLNQIATGNLRFELQYDYAGEFAKIKEALFLIRSTLTQTISEIKMVAGTVNQESNRLSTGSQTLAQGTTEQAASVEELSASIAQISEHVKDNANNAISAEELSVRSGQVVEKGNEQMREMMKAMEDISDSSHEIGKIIKTIDDIAFQTNILALNAAVEAARAGAAGKGFAVVADEVRNLAQKSAEAAKNTTQLIEHSVNTVNVGSRIADETAESLRTIVENSEQMLQLVREIASTSTEQSMAISQVTIGVEQVSQVIQMTSSAANETATTSGELSDQAEKLQMLVGQFVLDEN